MKSLQAVRGMKDVLPSVSHVWHSLEQTLTHLAMVRGYQEIRMPLLERTELFVRSIGDETDIVGKEMYTFLDRNGESVTLRPEGTASCVRAGNEHGLFYHQFQRLFYLGSMFRYERPQKGRYRQFSQFGMEAFGYKGVDIEAELIEVAAVLWRQLGLDKDIRLEINSLGSENSRHAYRDVLVRYLKSHQSKLDEDSARRLETNPLRILDSKHPEIQAILEGAPRFDEYLDAASKEHAAKLHAHLNALHIPYTCNPRLVRGLDYYNDTVFEWVSDSLGAQGTVCAGGRYDGLVESLGGAATPAAGFAIGLDRLIDLLTEQGKAPATPPVDVYVISTSEPLQEAAVLAASTLRHHFPDRRVVLDGTSSGLKAQYKRAEKLGARFALLIDDEHYAHQQAVVKNLQEGSQTTVSLGSCATTFSEIL